MCIWKIIENTAMFMFLWINHWYIVIMANRCETSERAHIRTILSIWPRINYCSDIFGLHWSYVTGKMSGLSRSLHVVRIGHVCGSCKCRSFWSMVSSNIFNLDDLTFENLISVEQIIFYWIFNIFSNHHIKPIQKENYVLIKIPHVQ